MNDSSQHEAEAIRSEIDTTRRRMDETMDALGDRLRPQHLLDEILGLFRRSTEGDGKLTEVREKVTHSAETAMNAVIDTVKKNPMPALLIGAGVAWMIYENRRSSSADFDEDRSGYSDDLTPEGVRYDPDMHYDRPLDYPARAEGEWSDQGGSKLGGMKEKLSEKAHEAGGQMKEKLSHAGEVARERAQNLKQRAGETLHAARERASQLGHRVGERTRQAYSRTRERVASTADQHPLESGLGLLALGLIVGLAVPTPRIVHRTAGRAVDKLRSRTREAGSEFVEKSKRVAQAAVSAAKEEAHSQGLASERMHEQGSFPERQRQEGSMPEGNQSGSQISDPTLARQA